jgi:hypothetical protein
MKMKLRDFKEETLAFMDCHEVVEAFVDQSLYVAIWRHDSTERSVFSYEVKQLPDGHYSPRETKNFTVESEVPHGVNEAIDYGETIKIAYYDNLAEPMLKFVALTIKNDRAS